MSVCVSRVFLCNLVPLMKKKKKEKICTMCCVCVSFYACVCDCFCVVESKNVFQSVFQEERKNKYMYDLFQHLCFEQYVYHF